MRTNIDIVIKDKATSKPRIFSGLSVGFIAVFLAACGDDNDNDQPIIEEPVVVQEFQVDVVNLTAGQPFSPIAVIAHTEAYSAFTLGEAATLGLEILAEGGQNTDLIAEAEADDAVIATTSGENPLGPGATETLTFMIDEDQVTGLLMTGITMLVNSNDAITAIQAMSLEGMAVGDTVTLNTISYDSGTEANSELIGTIPGPADGGEGFNAARDDVADEVRIHSGVITSDDGLAVSRLTEIHRWDNPVARITVTRTQ